VTEAPTRAVHRCRRTPSALGIAATLVAAVTLAATSAACADDRAKYDYLRIQVDGQPTLSITKSDVLVRGIVVFFHGQDEDEFVLTVDAARKAMTDRLVNAGFAVVASRAGGNSFTTAAAVNNYRELASVAMQHYRIANIYLLAESTGAVAAANLLAAGAAPVRGMAAISPVLNVHNTTGRPTSSTVENPPPTPQAANPIDLPVASLAGTNLRFYIDDADPVAKTAVNAAAFENKFGPAAAISVVRCSGGYTDPSCYQPDDVVKWFTSLDNRSSS
jgi:alpha-beta hydrolase superfamily lysophospholipase